MNGLERVLAAVRLMPTDRVPVAPQVFGFAGVLAGAPLGDYVRDGELLARCQLDALHRYGYDAVFAFMDLAVETEAAGSLLTYYPDRYPDVASYILTPDAGPERLPIPDPHRSGRMPELLRALGILRREAGGKALVAGALVGPMTLATQLLGIEDALYLAADEPGRFERMLDFAVEVAIRYGTAQLEAGADMAVVFDPASSPAVVPPAFFREFLLPRLKRVFAAFRQAGAAANWLNVAGPTEPNLAWYPEAGADIANMDYDVDPQAARRRLPRTCLDGNMKPLSFVLDEPAQIEAEARRLVALFADRGGFILSSGCEIPPEARPENIAAMVAAVRPPA